MLPNASRGHDRRMIASHEPDRTVVVGVDGSESADRALRWAALEAVRRSATLRIVNVWMMPSAAWAAPVSIITTDPSGFMAGAAEVLEQARSTARQAVDGEPLVIEVSSVEGRPAECLLRASGGAPLLVLGTGGRGGFVRLLLGSVTVTCAHHSAVPLAIVGADSPAPGSGDVVVGVDDSVGGHTALRWAATEAVRLGVGLRAVHAWDVLDASTALAAEFAPDLVESARMRLRHLVEKEISDLAVRPPIEVIAAPQAAAEALVMEAKTAALLVVGSRGLGGFVGQVMGSVSQHCLHYSPCPLVIVPTMREQLAT
jgi:nucleotide-binding universal stress UspA family protein